MRTILRSLFHCGSEVARHGPARSEVRGQRPEVRGQRPEVGGQISKRVVHLFPNGALVLALALVSVIAAGCGRQNKPATQAPLPPTATVRAQKVELAKHIATEETVGTVRSKLRAQLEAKVAGRILEMRAVAGQPVKAGELLARLDAQEIRARLDQALATQAQANSDLKRYTALLKQTAATEAEFDAVQARARVADAAVKEAQAMLGYMDVQAPFDGVVTRKLADVGDLAAPGKPLVDVEDPSHLQFETDIPEAIMGTVKLGVTIPVRVSGCDGRLQAKVSEIAPAADPNTRTFRVKLDLPPAAGLRAGQFGRAEVPLAETATLRVPASALVRRGDLEMVFVVANGHAQMRLVKAGRHVGDEVEIASGLSPGETVVTENAGLLVDGQPVDVKP
jgi:RND family efflux transporter MFP subunit